MHCYIKGVWDGSNIVYSFEMASSLPQGGRTVVHLSAAYGRKEVLELLIDKYSLSATEKDDVSSYCIA